MNKKEIVWREVLQKAIEDKKNEFTQKELAEKFGFSLSTVFNALKIPRQTGAIDVSGRNFVVRDVEKLLYLWATHRNLGREIVYQTHVEATVKEIEGGMPAGAIFAAYSAYAQKFGEAPADYSQVYVYAGESVLEEIKKRFPKKRGYINLFVIESDVFLKNFEEVSPDVQIYADLWNLKDWYAKDFLKALKEKVLN